MVVGDHQRFISAIITFVVDVDFTNGQPSDNLESECARFFKDHLGLDITLASEAVKHP
jgi:hypothetical protein